jgi:hypothetical protein
MPHDRRSGRCSHRADYGEAECPEREPNQDALASFASGNARSVQTVKAHRHPWAAFVRTIDSVSARHDTVGTTDTLGRNVRVCVNISSAGCSATWHSGQLTSRAGVRSDIFAVTSRAGIRLSSILIRIADL